MGKICNKCKIEKDLSEFHKDNSNKDRLRIICKICASENGNEYRKKNRKYEKLRHKKYYIKNKERIKKYNKKNKEQITRRSKNRKNSKINYDTLAEQISYADKIKNVDRFLQTKCAYCGKWYFPTVQEIENRIKALNGKASSIGTENRLYCSTEYKEACPIYNKRLYQEGHPLKNENSSREVQPELRQMVFEHDNYTCLKCGKHQDELNVPLHCHHIEGIRWNPLESADIDQCMTVCKDCHKEIHKQTDCGYHDLQCKEI